MTSLDQSTWASVPWTPIHDDTETIGYHKHLVPYIPGSTNSLKTLDVWIPPSEPPPSAASLPSLPGHWIIFLHGGAWRDPAVSASSFLPTAVKLLRRHRSAPGHIAGLASLNYRLSPHPRYPPPLGDVAHSAHHPDHIADVLTGIAFLQRLGAGINSPYVLAGHSCGAMLAFQATMGPSRWGLRNPEIKTPAIVVGLNGLYDLAGFIATPDPGYEGLRDAYEEFTTAAFGPQEKVWREVCPATAERGWVGEWAADGGKEVVLVQSGEDTLVPRSQLERMKSVLEGEGMRVREMEAGGEHDELWQEGERMADILGDMILAMAARSPDRVG